MSRTVRQQLWSGRLQTLVAPVVASHCASDTSVTSAFEVRGWLKCAVFSRLTCAANAVRRLQQWLAQWYATR
jgi:hypothetical protein